MEKKAWSLCVWLLFLLAGSMPAEARKHPRGSEQADGAEPQKYEFRGAWVQTVFQDRYQKRNTRQNQAYLKGLVESLHEAGVNAVIFQVRTESDAFYDSPREPWSRFLTGLLGRAPREKWDPLQYMIDLCHERHMELHAWVNPYRLSASRGRSIKDHPLYKEHPDWCVQFGQKWYLDPGRPEVRGHVREVVKDIVSRYDVDAIHFDDYFYPYPEPGYAFDDRVSFQTYAPLLHIDTEAPTALADFRRRSVDILVKYVHDDIQALKPWVRFGISPFGIYRNQTAWSKGSMTKGTQCYEDLYADVVGWAHNGWIDYVVPQLYWEIGHAVADYATLVKWWAEAIPASCQLYIGESIERSLDDPKDARPEPDLRLSHTHMMNKVNMARSLKAVDGLCFWYAYQIEDNAFHVRELLQQNVFTHKALVPPFTTLRREKPAPVEGLKVEPTEQGVHVSWKPAKRNDTLKTLGGVTYNVYKFAKGEKISVDDVTHLLIQTETPSFFDYDLGDATRFTYVVTVQDRFGNEGAAAKKKFRVVRK